MRTPREWVKDHEHLEFDGVVAALEARDTEARTEHEAELERHIESGQDALRVTAAELAEARAAALEEAAMYTHGFFVGPVAAITAETVSRLADGIRSLIGSPMPAPTACESWCGTDRQPKVFVPNWDGNGPYFCTEACRDRATKAERKEPR